MLVKVAQVLNLVNFIEKYIEAMNSTNINTTQKLKLTKMKKY